MKYVAQLTHVREVSLLGTADLAYWKDRLAPENHTPAERDGKAQVLIIAADARFWGLPFRELSFSILVEPRHAPGARDAAYLLGAFNSRRFFAFSERTFFSTPYHFGDVRVSTSPRALIAVHRNPQPLFHAEMHAGTAGPTRESVRTGDDVWEGPVFLPRTSRGTSGPGRFFSARVAGEALRYAFDGARDTLNMSPAPGAEFLQSLTESRFAATEWLIRADATHAKSKTETRPAVGR